MVKQVKHASITCRTNSINHCSTVARGLESSSAMRTTKPPIRVADKTRPRTSFHPTHPRSKEQGARSRQYVNQNTQEKMFVCHRMRAAATETHAFVWIGLVGCRTITCLVGVLHKRVCHCWRSRQPRTAAMSERQRALATPGLVPRLAPPNAAATAAPTRANSSAD